MSRKKIFFLALNYIQISLCLLIVGWVYGYKRTTLMDEDYIGLIIFFMLIVFISNSLRNIFYVKDLTNQRFGNKILTVASIILTFLFIISVGLMLIVSASAIYDFFMGKTSNTRKLWGEIVAVVLSIISLIVLVNQYWFRSKLKKAHKKELESEIDIIGSEHPTHE